MASPAQLERLSTALDADTRARCQLEAVGFTPAAISDAIRAGNVLYDTCVDAGMPLDVADDREWAAVRVTKWLCAA
jgi:hypothetical protein